MAEGSRAATRERITAQECGTIPEDRTGFVKARATINLRHE